MRDDDLIEPGEFEKGKIQAVAEDILVIAKKPSADLGTDIRTFAADAKLDFFTVLEKSELPFVKIMGGGMNFRAAFLAHIFLLDVMKSIGIYIDKNQSVKPWQRKKILADYITSKKVFDRKHEADYDLIGGMGKAAYHMTQTGLFLDVRIKEFLKQETTNNPMLARFNDAIGASKDPLEFGYPLETHPELIGFIYAQYVEVSTMARHVGQLHGMDAGELALQTRQIKDAYMQMLAQPRKPAPQSMFVTGSSALN